MSTNYTTETSDRPSSRGRRRPRRRSDSRSSSEGRSSSSTGRGGARRSPAGSRKEPKKLTLWERIVAFFGGGQASATQKPAFAERPESAESSEKPVRQKRAPRSEFRKPELVEVTTPRVYVGNLSFDATESDLVDLFAGVGLVQNAEIVCNRETHRSKGFAFVQMQSVDEAKRAVTELHDKEYMGRKLVVSGAKASDRRDDRSQQPEQ